MVLEDTVGIPSRWLQMGAERAAFRSRPLVGEGRRSCPSLQRRVAVLQRGEQVKLGFKEDYEGPGRF